ncbi:MAG: electron transfer flavoprotein subunit alpha/FixB family protein [Erysipelotrichales bacterium]|nr:electron transfer flavoprotein subunit alpha/FixB family protein [Erysipelotrichales bacterium]
MKKLVVHQEKLTEEIIADLIKLCPFDAFERQGKELLINEACKFCKICVNKGPKGVIEFFETKEENALDKTKWRDIGVYVEHQNNKIHPVAFELLAKAKELAKKINQKAFAIIIGHQTETMVAELLSHGADIVYVYDQKELAKFNIEAYTNVFEDFIEKIKPSSLLFGGTAQGRSFAPKVAGRFKTGLTADCTKLDVKANTDLIQIRPAFGGNIMAQIICPSHRPQLATVRYKIFKAGEKVTPHGIVKKMTLDGISFASTIKVISETLKEKTEDISEAEVLIAVGRAFKSQAELKIVYELADLLGASIACTRPMSEQGLIDAKKQIGLSGRTVSPKVIINLGISGAIQYATGIAGSELVISINSDPKAPIFAVSHYSIVGNVFEIVPELIEKIKKGK